MPEITVQEYAKRFNTSVQSVYKRIKRGGLMSVERNGRKYVVIDNESVQPVESGLNTGIQPSTQPSLMEWLDFLTKELDRLQEENARLHKDNRRLVKKLEKCNKEQKKVLVSYIQELKQLQLMHQPVEEIIEAEPEEIKPKKKKKRRKNKKHN